LAAARGIYVGVLPTWGDKVDKVWGRGPVILTPRNAEAYGVLLARRWRDRDHLVYVLGGDRNPVGSDRDTSAVWRAMARGIRQVVGGDALIAYHPQGGRGSSLWFHHDDWLDFHLWQSGHMAPDAPIWDWVTADYTRAAHKPVMDGEPNYEDHPINPFTRAWTDEYGRFTDHDVRKQAYRAAFAGACGHVYGHHSVWQFYDETRAPVNFPDPAWRQAIVRPGAEQIGHLRTLMQARSIFDRIPDQTIILSDVGTGSDHIRACRADAGHYALVYVPTPDTRVEIDLPCLTGQTVRAAWFDPRCGTTTPIDVVPTDAPAPFVTPSSAPDWVLMLDAV
ncbi:MAG: glycoside hydrolase family 140 protein, partial [Chloroflexota bacterium]|nr:glycoside hydrolase family 140 protein [Chloroflexota bacterium]